MEYSYICLLHRVSSKFRNPKTTKLPHSPPRSHIVPGADCENRDMVAVIGKKCLHRIIPFTSLSLRVSSDRASVQDCSNRK